MNEIVNDQFPSGRMITAVRPLSREEADEYEWPGSEAPATVLVLDDGSLLFSSEFDATSWTGALIGILPNGKKSYVFSGNEYSSTPIADTNIEGSNDVETPPENASVASLQPETTIDKM